MTHVMRRALEAYDEKNGGNGEADDEFIVMKGPLSQIYTDALNKVYANQAPLTGQIAAESAANDEMMMQAMASDFVNQQDSDQAGGPTTVYGVDSRGVTEDDVTTLTQTLAGISDKIVLIMDSTVSGPNSPIDSPPPEQVQVLSNAMETMVLAHKGRVFRSLQEYAASRRR
jgi:hypothetical protein